MPALIRDRLLMAVIIVLLGTALPAQEETSYPDGNGGSVTLPMGDLSFADAAVSFEMGEPEPIAPSRDPGSALGPPDWEDLDAPENWLTLGCGGHVVLRFDDNALIDIEGTDLYIFEIGPDAEDTFLAISEDGTDWIEVGKISGGRADVDIGPHVDRGASFSHVRLTDDGKGCSGRWPGADIDSVAAIGTAERFVLDGSVLFEFDSATLRPEAQAALRTMADRFAGRDLARIGVEGHTDSRGEAEYNRDLSLRRAEAVRDWLGRQDMLADVPFGTRGAGESSPVADNGTEEGRQKNRRVEIIVVPAR